MRSFQENPKGKNLSCNKKESNYTGNENEYITPTLKSNEQRAVSVVSLFDWRRRKFKLVKSDLGAESRQRDN